MSTPEEILNMIEEDKEIDRSNLEGELFRTPRLRAKYIKLRFNMKLIKNNHDEELSNAIVDRMNYYYGNGSADDYREAPFSMSVKNQDHLNKLLNGDKKLSAMHRTSENYGAIIELIDEFSNDLKFRNNHIATAIEIRKFENGE